MKNMLLFIRNVLKSSKVFRGGVIKPYIIYRDRSIIAETLEKFRVHKSFKIIWDMVSEFLDYKVLYNEFFLFGFYEEHRQNVRRSFVSDVERQAIATKINGTDNDLLFYHKYKTYQKFGEYYRRDVILYEGKKDDNNLKDFVLKHNRIICKPIDGGCGKGIRIFDLGDYNLFNDLLDELKDFYNQSFIVEQLVLQNEELSSIHSNSVNTVRMPTCYFSSDNIKIVHPFLRVGIGNSIVDNAGSGGIICAIDTEGIVYATSDELGNMYQNHPDTGANLVGFQVPNWAEAKKMAIKLAKSIPSQKYCSWDLALNNENNWVLIEANAKGQFIWQYATKKGFREELDFYLSEWNIEYLY